MASTAAHDQTVFTEDENGAGRDDVGAVGGYLGAGELGVETL